MLPSAAKNEIVLLKIIDCIRQLNTVIVCISTCHVLLGGLGINMSSYLEVNVRCAK